MSDEGLGSQIFVGLFCTVIGGVILFFVVEKYVRPSVLSPVAATEPAQMGGTEPQPMPTAGKGSGEKGAPGDMTAPPHIIPRELAVGGHVFKVYDLYFAPQSWELNEDAQKRLSTMIDDLAQLTKERGVYLEGYADAAETESISESIGLAQRRADAVRNYLVRLGFDPTRIASLSYGSGKPVCTGTVEDCAQLNRRVQVELANQY